MEMVKFSKNNAFTRIKLSYLDETTELTDKDIEKKNRLEHVWGLRVNNKYSPNQCIEILIKQHSVSRATAYRDYSWAMQIFGDIDKAQKDAEKKVLMESYWNIYQRCINAENFDGARKALDSYKSLFDFDATENPLENEKLKAHEYNIRLPRWVYKKIAEISESGVADFMGMDVEDVDFAEVEPENADDDE